MMRPGLQRLSPCHDIVLTRLNRYSKFARKSTYAYMFSQRTLSAFRLDAVGCRAPRTPGRHARLQYAIVRATARAALE